MINELSTEEFLRYQHQINLLDIQGQVKLKEASVLCVGAGGLGSPLLLYLAAAGIGTLGIIDHDKVSLSNLHRQILYSVDSVGRDKVFVAREKLLELNPTISIQVYNQKLSIDNANGLIQTYDIVVDCSDNFITRYLINDTCLKLAKPFVSASVQGFEGQCILYLGNSGPCLRCLYPEVALTTDCNEGIMGMVPGIMGLIQATEVIKWILGQGAGLVGRLLTMNVLTMHFDQFDLPRRLDCEACAPYRTIGDTDRPSDPIFDNFEGNKTMNKEISVSELKQILASRQPLQLVDVRTIEKRDAFNIGGLHIPLEELAERISELRADQPIVTYCTSGGKSMMALNYLNSVGFETVQSLQGGMTAWRQMIE